MSDSPKRSSGQIIASLVGVWFLIALAIGVAGFYRNISAPGIAITLWGMVAVALLAARKIVFIREWIAAVDLRVLVAIHLTRFVGIYFLVLGSRGELPSGFAKPAGIGDTIVAVGAVVLIAMSATPAWRAFVRVWNFFGFIDIIFVVFSALRFGLQDWQSMSALRSLPLSLLPMFFVPVIIVSHVLIFVRLTKAEATGIK